MAYSSVSPCSRTYRKSAVRHPSAAISPRCRPRQPGCRAGRAACAPRRCHSSGGAAPARAGWACPARPWCGLGCPAHLVVMAGGELRGGNGRPGEQVEETRQPVRLEGQALWCHRTGPSWPEASTPEAKKLASVVVHVGKPFHVRDEPAALDGEDEVVGRLRAMRHTSSVAGGRTPVDLDGVHALCGIAEFVGLPQSPGVVAPPRRTASPRSRCSRWP